MLIIQITCRPSVKFRSLATYDSCEPSLIKLPNNRLRTAAPPPTAWRTINGPRFIIVITAPLNRAGGTYASLSICHRRTRPYRPIRCPSLASLSRSVTGRHEASITVPSGSDGGTQFPSGAGSKPRHHLQFETSCSAVICSRYDSRRRGPDRGTGSGRRQGPRRAPSGAGKAAHR